MSDTKRRKLFTRRTWLNTNARLRAHMVGFVTHEAWTDRDGRERQSIDASLMISDCDRTVTLDFDTYSDDGPEAMREKVRRTRRFVGDFCDAVDKALDKIEASA